VDCGTACCAGTGCCGGGACQTAHANGLRQSYFDCGSFGTYTLATASLAAGAWAPIGGSDTVEFFGGSCLSRATGSACATWCYTGKFSGQVQLTTSSTICLSPTTISPRWD
jgi:hypothetical protein